MTISGRRISCVLLVAVVAGLCSLAYDCTHTYPGGLRLVRIHSGETHLCTSEGVVERAIVVGVTRVRVVGRKLYCNTGDGRVIEVDSGSYITRELSDSEIRSLPD